MSAEPRLYFGPALPELAHIAARIATLTGSGDAELDDHLDDALTAVVRASERVQAIRREAREADA